MKCSSPKRDKANQILTMKSLILTEIVNFLLRNFPIIQYVTVRKMTTCEGRQAEDAAATEIFA